MVCKFFYRLLSLALVLFIICGYSYANSASQFSPFEEPTTPANDRCSNSQIMRIGFRFDTILQLPEPRTPSPVNAKKVTTAINYMKDITRKLHTLFLNGRASIKRAQKAGHDVEDVKQTIKDSLIPIFDANLLITKLPRDNASLVSFLIGSVRSFFIPHLVEQMSLAYQKKTGHELSEENIQQIYRNIETLPIEEVVYQFERRKHDRVPSREDDKAAITKLNNAFEIWLRTKVIKDTQLENVSGFDFTDMFIDKIGDTGWALDRVGLDFSFVQTVFRDGHPKQILNLLYNGKEKDERAFWHSLNNIWGVRSIILELFIPTIVDLSKEREESIWDNVEKNPINLPYVLGFLILKSRVSGQDIVVADLVRILSPQDKRQLFDKEQAKYRANFINMVDLEYIPDPK